MSRAAGGQFHYVPVRWPSTPAPDYGVSPVMGVSADPTGRVFVFQRSRRHPVLVFDRSGRFIKSWGAGQFTEPHGCRVAPDGTVWLTDDGDHRVLQFTPDGAHLVTLGIRNSPGISHRQFNRPADVAFGSGGRIYVADGYGNSRVVEFAAGGRYVRAWGRRGTGPSEFHLVHSILAGPDSRLYVADRENRRIQVFTLTGKYLTSWAGLGYPFGLAVLDAGHLVVADGVADRLLICDLNGNVVHHWGGHGAAPGRFRRAHLVSTDSLGAIYVAEVIGKRIQKFEQSAH